MNDKLGIYKNFIGTIKRQQKRRNKVITADDPRMGKTSTILRLCKSKDQSEFINTAHWII